MSDGLRDLQRGFQARVLGTSDRGGVRVGGDRRASAGERLQVYAEALQLRFAEALRADYPGLLACLGEDGFSRLAREYAAACPSRHPSIRWFGAGLAGFLAARDPWREQPLLADMAAFEWAKSELLDAADSPVVALEEVAAVPPAAWAGMRLRPVYAIRRIRLHWNAPAIGQALREERDPPRAESADTPTNWLLWRNGLQVHWRSTDANESRALDRLQHGVTFGALCALLLEDMDGDAAALRAASWLKQWVSDALIAGIDPDD